MGAWIVILIILAGIAVLGFFLNTSRPLYEIVKNLDRRWIFLTMFLAVALPLMLSLTFPEKPSGLARAVFQEIEDLDKGDKVLLAWDFDPASEGELGPMATAFTFHCASKGLKLYYITTWPVGPQMIVDNINEVLARDFPEYTEGEDYVNLGFKPGYEGVIKVIASNIRELYTTDHKGTSVQDIPMMDGINNIQQMDLIINVSAGYSGTKEWVLFAATPYPDKIKLVAGCTGVQAPLLYPYIPEQLRGLLGAIKGAAEYEQLVQDKYGGENPPLRYLKCKLRMGPQLIAHVLIIILIVVANLIFFAGRKWEGAK